MQHAFFKFQLPRTSLSNLLLPTRFLKLENIFDGVIAGSVGEEIKEEILQDVEEKCAEFGFVKSVCHFGSAADEINIIVEFKNSVDCASAQKCLMGQKFDGNTVIATFADHNTAVQDSL